MENSGDKAHRRILVDGWIQTEERSFNPAQIAWVDWKPDKRGRIWITICVGGITENYWPVSDQVEIQKLRDLTGRREPQAEEFRD
jgi:hypothetical protein